MTGEQIAALVAAGRFWWMRGDEFFATDTHDPEADGDVYLLDASPEWLTQWHRDWQAIADFLTPMLEQAIDGGLAPKSARPARTDEL